MEKPRSVPGPEKPEAQKKNEPASGPIKAEDNDSSSAFFWLLVGLAPILILLNTVSSQSSNRYFPLVLIVCGICNLCGGLGCLSRIKNIAVRIILGTLLGIFFFLLSVIVAAFQACSHMGGI